MSGGRASGSGGHAAFLRFRAELRRGGFAVDAAFSCERRATALFGPSGAGKTTILDAIAGLLRPSRGEIAIGGEVVFSSTRGIDLPPERRGVGYVFQDGALFPHRSVKANLLYGSRHRRGDRPAPPFADVVELLDLAHLLERRPAALSGGERQRVAIGRAILSAPRLLLLDEPLASLDLGLRDRILPYLLRVRDELDLPFLYVSHAIAEVAEVAEEAVVVDAGRVIAQGAPLEVLSRPEVFAVADRLGIENAFEVEVADSDASCGTSVVKLGRRLLRVPRAAVPRGTRLLVTVRADEVLVAVEEPRGLSARNVLPGEVRRVQAVGGKILVYLDVGVIMIAEVTPEARVELDLEPGKPAFAVVKSHSFRVRGIVGRRGGGEPGAEDVT